MLLSRMLRLIIILALAGLSWPRLACAQCMDEAAKRISRRDSTLEAVLEARDGLARYDVRLALLEQFPTIPEHLILLDKERGELLQCALWAYFWAGHRQYPQDPTALMQVLDDMSMAEYDGVGQWPLSLQELVDCGILPHLPASPHATGAYLGALPKQPQPGDVYYEARANTSSTEPYLAAGRVENYALAIFDQECTFSQGQFYTDETMGQNFTGDVTAFIPLGKYATICYLTGYDMESVLREQRIRLAEQPPANQ